MKTKIVDKGLKNILKQQKAAVRNTYTTIGVHKDAEYSNGKKVAEVAYLLHEGTRIMPARPFIRRDIKANQKKYLKYEAKLLSAMMKKGRAINFVLTEVGLKIMIDVQNSIKKAPRWAAPLAEATKLLKTGRLLIESGTLLTSIGFQNTVKGRTNAVKRSK